MELTNELKARFFALYWGQQVGKIEPTKEYLGLCWVKHFDSLHPVISPSELSYLELRPLSSITEEEATEVANTVYPYVTDSERVDLDAIVKYLTGIYPIDGSEDTTNNMFHLCDYLRSKGFALPFMGISVDEMLKAEWIKLKE